MGQKLRHIPQETVPRITVCPMPAMHQARGLRKTYPPQGSNPCKLRPDNGISPRLLLSEGRHKIASFEIWKERQGLDTNSTTWDYVSISGKYTLGK